MPNIHWWFTETQDPELLQTDPDYYEQRLPQLKMEFERVKSWLTSKWEHVKERSRYLEALMSEIAKTSGKKSPSYLFIRQMYLDLMDGYGKFMRKNQEYMEECRAKHMIFFCRIRELDRQARANRGEEVDMDPNRNEDEDFQSYESQYTMEDWAYEHLVDMSNDGTNNDSDSN